MDIPPGTVESMAGSTVADLVGRVLAGRYRLLGAIGSGASGRVYVADDVRLRRRVAVKVLHAALAEDAGFLRRFRTEAQLAASLHHPNVMAVYDWGEDGVPFMVLELLAGGSLRAMLDRGNQLTPAQTAHVSNQVAGALEYAHSRGLVHRDIKPANLLFDEHGIVRVADFGLARALAEASWTEPAGTVLGTARYAAPEQATGAALDGRADLYALGLVMVESVTGSVPLVGDSPMGTLGLRQASAIEVPAAMGPLGAVVARACAALPDDRYANADEMRGAIAEAVEVLPLPGPLVLAGLGEVSDDPHPTQVVRPQAAPPLFDQDQAAVTNAPRALPVAIARVPRRSRSSAPVVLGLVVLLALAAVVFVVARPSAGAATPVPLLVGKNRPDAQKIVAAKFLIVPEYRTKDDPKGYIFAQRPAPGSFLAEGSAIHILISEGLKPVPIPPVVGKTQAEAKALLDPLFFPNIVPRADETAPAGQVIRTRPKDFAQPDDAVDIFVSTGPRPRVVPNVVDKSYSQAVELLQVDQLGATRVDEFSDTVKKDVVIRSDPPSGTEVPRDTPVKVVVSQGPDLVVVPDFSGKTVQEATDLATAAGVELDIQGKVNKTRKVRVQIPAVGEKVARGTAITIVF